MAKTKLAARGGNKTQAEKKKDFVNGLYRGITTPILEDGEISIGYAYQRFRLEQEAKGNSKQTIAYYDRFIKKYNTFCIEAEGVSINEIPVSMLENQEEQNWFIDFLGDVNRQTINSYLRAYRALGNYCFDKGLIKHFYCPIKEIEPAAKEVYTEKEITKLLKKPSIDNFEEYRNYCIISLILATGARRNTIINIKIKDVDLEDGYITFNTTKAHKVARIGLERKVKSELKQYILRWRYVDGNGEVIPDSDYLFCNTYGEQLTSSGITTAIARYNKKRGVEKTSIHLLRHTYAKNWITSGGDIISLAKVLTHSELDMVKRYSNLYGEDVKAEIEQHSILSNLRSSSGRTLKTSVKRSS